MDEQPQSQALKKLDEILAFGWDIYTQNAAEVLRTAMTLMPMSMVLDKVPGETIGEKSKRIGISRNSWYAWYGGGVRPNRRQAKRLQRLTGIPAEKFQGRR